MSTAPPNLPKKAKCIAPIPVPTHGSGGVFAVAVTTDIAGPALLCLEKVLDLPNYGTWNTFVPRASVISTPTTPTPTDNEAPLPPDVQALTSRPGYATRGSQIRFDAVMTPGGSSRAVDLEVSFLETLSTADGSTGYRVVWKTAGSMPHFLLRSERVQEFVESVTEDEKTVTSYTTWETFGGALGYVLPRTQIESGFDRWTEGLKRVVEEEVGGRGE
ncbi:hypothetical protein F4678DRAFT_460499 [Xylaria arbuscula]|nr:hypothetical protein F4678DRAFT_460499 [Xylaria arbuscula]